MSMYNVEFSLGQALVDASSQEEAKEYAQGEWGRLHGPYKVTAATKEDKAWVKSMGGIVHTAKPREE